MTIFKDLLEPFLTVYKDDKMLSHILVLKIHLALEIGRDGSTFFGLNLNM